MSADGCVAMSDLLQFLKDEAARNYRLAEKAETVRRRKTRRYRAKHLQRAADDLAKLRRDNKLLEATLRSSRIYYEEGDPAAALRDIVSRINDIERDMSKPPPPSDQS